MEIFWFTCTSALLSSGEIELPLPVRRVVRAEDLLAAIPAPPAAIVVETNRQSAAEALNLIGGIRGQQRSPALILVLDRGTARAEAGLWLRAGADAALSGTAELAELLAGFGERQGIPPLVGISRAMRSVIANVRLVAAKRCNVLIEGETGTGKEVVARQIHATGSRSRGPWVAVNCGAIPESLLEAELFGHVKGAFTGAVQSRPGKFELANHGTIFLDEIGEMPLALQSRLLRVLQEREIERLGGNERIALDIRVIAATNRDLGKAVRAGLFRQDLFYRLNVFRLTIAPLRERLEDVPTLARHFAARFCAMEKIPLKLPDESAVDRLLSHDWQGNVRELENVIETAVILSGDKPAITADEILPLALAVDTRPGPDAARTGLAENTALNATARNPVLPADGIDYQEAVEAFEQSLITQAISRTRGNKTAAADLLRLKRTTLSARMRALESRLPTLVA